ncbi:MAG: ABC transporter, partial [Proteobacteria bacterium]|nr:ABC transporter [Pseudomonadota bacterium]
MAARDPSANAPLERAKSRNVAALRPLLRYVAPHRWRIVGAAIALLIAASTVLALGAGLRFLIDRGFVGADAALLDRAVLILLGVVAVLALASYCRFYLVSWIGERAIADLRRDVYAHVIGLDAGFFDATRSSEIGARLTTDTSVIQTVVGSSVSVALRNAL